MNLIAENRSTYSSVDNGSQTHIITDTSAELSAILEPGVNLSVWRRPEAQEISEELVVLQPHHLPDVRCPTSPSTFAADVSRLLKQSGLPPEAFSLWRADLHRLALLYFPLAVGRRVTLRLETTDQDGCRRFHTDRTHLRLLCTFRGPGTEWLMDTQVDRDAERANASNDEILRYGEPSQLQSFWVGILKGTAFPGNAQHGLVHRSPPIGQSGQVRVLFCLDC
ncbi:MAG: DUF1826 domain-containing protein [Pseudomonadota bacterium]